jgi:hypothetical protein
MKMIMRSNAIPMSATTTIRTRSFWIPLKKSLSGSATLPAFAASSVLFYASCSKTFSSNFSISSSTAITVQRNRAWSIHRESSSCDR